MTSTASLQLSGRTLAVAGIQAPVLFPERLVLIEALVLAEAG